MRDGFREAVKGWMLTDDVEGVGEYIEASARWVKENGGEAALEDDERATVRMMIECQIVRGVKRGDFEPYFPADLDEGEIRRIINW